MSLYDRVCAIAKEKKLAISKIERECNLSNATIRRWTTQNPSLESVQKVAHYLNVSIDYLAGISEQPKFHCNDVPLSQMETDVIAMLRVLGTQERKVAVDFITMLYEQATGEKGSVYSTYIEGEYKQTSGPAADGDSESVIA